MLQNKTQIPIDKLGVVLMYELAFAFPHYEFIEKYIIGCLLTGTGT